MSTYNKLLHTYQKEFNEKNISLETIKLFLFELCNEKNINLYLELDNQADKQLEEKFHSGIKRLLNDEPLNYVLGYSYFFGYKMIVNEGVLIPRYETEELIGLILSKTDEYYKDTDKIVACDVGTGSGAIAIALKKEEDKFEMYASDISFDAINVAKENAKLNEANIEFFVGDMLEPLKEKGIKLDVLISNPPYIPQEEKMEKSVIDYEPHVALFGGEDGLKFYRTLLSGAKDVMKEHGLIFFEIGYNQKGNMLELGKTYFPNAEMDVLKDINKKDRVFFLKF